MRTTNCFDTSHTRFLCNTHINNENTLGSILLKLSAAATATALPRATHLVHLRNLRRVVLQNNILVAACAHVAGACTTTSALARPTHTDDTVGRMPNNRDDERLAAPSRQRGAQRERHHDSFKS